MKSIVLIAVLVTFVAAEEAYYKTPDDKVDVDKIINNPAEFQVYIDCFLDRKPCTEVSQRYKDNIEDAVKTTCVKCTADQKKMFLKFIVGLQKSVPQDLEAFKAKYDPKGTYFQPLQKALSGFQ